MENMSFKKIEEYIGSIDNSPVFGGMSKEAVLEYLKLSKAQLVCYRKEDFVFLQDDLPEKMLILVDGAIAVCNDTVDGKRNIIAMVEHPGDMFGEIFLFLNHKEYEHYAQAMVDSLILEIPKEYFFDHQHGRIEDKARITSNLLGIFANKTYYLNQRLNILLCGSLRQKIAKILLKSQKNGIVKLLMNREEMADFVNTARPSLSRELMSMQSDGLIRVEKRTIYILNIEELARLV